MMKKAIAVATIAGLAAFGTAAPAQILGLNFAKQARQASQNPRPPESYEGQWYITPGGCSYSRAQAPGYPVHWVLILNPHHLGQPRAPDNCPYRL